MEKPNFTNIEYIEKYLSGALSKEEVEEFEQELETNLELKEMVESVENLPNDLLEIEKNRLSQNVKAWMNEDKKEVKDVPQDKKPIISIKRRILSVAAIFLLVISATWFYTSNSLDSKAQAFINTYHSNPIALRAMVDDRWEMAAESYTKRDFVTMRDQMDDWIEEDESTAEQLFYYALANLYSNDDAKHSIALDYLSQTEQKDPTTYQEEIAYYRALIYIKEEKYQKAKIELKQIEHSSTYGENAKDLLSKIQ